MGCGSSSSQEIVVPANNSVPNGNVKSEPEPAALPNNKLNHEETVAQQKDERIKSRESSASSKRSRKSSSSSSSSSGSRRSVKNQKPIDKEEIQPDQVDAVKPKAEDNTREPAKTETLETIDTAQPDTIKEPEKKEVQDEQEDEAGKNKPDNETTEAQEKPNFDQEVLKTFIDLESQIQELSAKDRESLRIAEYNRLLELYKAITTQGEKVEALKRQTIKEYQDVVQINQPSVRALFINQGQLDDQLAKETQEYLDALNCQEVAEQELHSMKEKYKNMYNAYNSSSESNKADEKHLQELRFEQEKLLGQIFNDSYGSDKEWKLEMELDLLGDKKERIQGAHIKWGNAQKFVRCAAGQINWAARRWAQITTHNVQAPMARYQMSAEARNHLIAASQNIKSVHKFLDPIRVPYYNTDDLQQLDAKLNTIFHDVQVPKRYRDAHMCFVDHYNKCQNLLNWIDQVFNNTITPDLNNVRKSYHEKYYELKEERMILIQAKIKEKLGVEMLLELKKEAYTEESGESNEQGESVVLPGNVNKEEGDDQAPEPETDSEEPPGDIPESLPPADTADGENAVVLAVEEESKPIVKAIPLAELAPAPNQENLFGDIEQLKKKHEEEIAEFERAQEVNKARVDQGLQEKLRARRSRKRKIQKQQEEEMSLGGESGNSLPAPPE